jgi:hypothetical protein
MGAVIVAERVRQFRQRKRNGDIQLTITVNEVDLVEALRHAGFIDPFEEDHEKIRQALQRAVEIWLIEETK